MTPADSPDAPDAQKSLPQLLGEFWRNCHLPEDRWEQALAGYRRYWQLIEQYNASAGLMAEQVDEASFFLKHVADSLSVLMAWPELLAGGRRLADVGCGAGLPGVVLAIALPGLRLTAVESSRKKARFLELALGELGLSDRAEVVVRQSRELGYINQYRGKFDVVTARAVAASHKLIREVRLLIAPGGSALFYKTPQAVEEELPNALRDAEKHHLAVEVSAVVELPAGAGSRQFMRIAAPLADK